MRQKLFITFTLFHFFTLTLLHAQDLQEMQYEEIPGANILLDRADRSLLIVESTIPKLMFESTRGIKPGSVKEEKPGVWYVYLEPGVQLISITAEGYLPVRDVRHNFQPRQAWQLKVTGDQPKGVGSIRIETDPSGANIILNNIPVPGTTPLTLQDQPTGTHSIRIDKDSYGSLEETVTIEKDKTVTQTFNLQKEYAGLKVTSDPSGAVVFLDGDRLGKTPLDRGDLTPGEGTLVVSMKDYETVTRQVRLVADHPKVENIDLFAQTGSVSITCDPTGAEIFLDGMSIGKYAGTSLKCDKLALGNHSTRAAMEGYEEAASNFTIEYNKITPIKLSLRGLPGAIYVMTTPEGADIALDGRPTGKKTGAKLENVTAGSHQIRLSLAEYGDIEKTVMIKPGKTETLSEKMSAKSKIKPSIENIRSGGEIRSPASAILLSLLFPGLGQFYNGEIKKGTIIGCVSAMSWGSFAYCALDKRQQDPAIAITGLAVGSLLSLYSMIDAKFSADRLNNEITREMKSGMTNPYIQFGIKSNGQWIAKYSVTF